MSRKCNLAAGFRRLGARSHARLLDDQVEGLCRIDAADRMLLDLMSWARAQHEELLLAKGSVRAANERASTAVYEQPAITIEATA